MFLLELAKANRKSFYLLLWMGTLPLLVSSVITYYALSYEENIRLFGAMEWFAFFLLSCFSMGLALTPTTFIAIVTGYFLGIQAVIPMLIAYLIASFIGYNLTHFIDKGTFINSLRAVPSVSDFIQKLNTRQFGLIVLSRISPVLPFAIMNVVLPVIGIRLRSFLLAGFLGMLPRTLLFIWVGSQAKTLKTLLEKGERNSFLEVSFVLLLIISIMGFYVYLKNIISKKLEKGTKKEN
ncbi:TVP38/TMEM64 family protein [Xanthovirga aplysinae]|uniref:TVP38/TMEM64 family protein n=1 Tax=Xanthovirga aplysinae TaxID=2529853 RepID=UPI0012BB708D|nr:VTT domain-containing protein [Xanthovirga aplysinae]MTI32670.1 DedA family protein [Xanthovirga aplysinae]